jgi:tetratricopeptide (TPR) repeat protein
MAKSTMSIARAIWVGLLWVNGPVMLLLIGVPTVGVLAMTRLPPADAGWKAAILLSSIVLGFTLAWLWWSVTVPKWRLWAYERVDDIPRLKARAVAVGLVWPDGHVFERTEIKTRAHAEQERALEERARESDSEDETSRERDASGESLLYYLCGAAGLYVLLFETRIVESDYILVNWSGRMWMPISLMVCGFTASNLVESGVQAGTRIVLRVLAVTFALATLWAYWPEYQIRSAKANAEQYRINEAVTEYSAIIDAGRLPVHRLAQAYLGRGDARFDYTTSFGVSDPMLVMALNDHQRARTLDPQSAAAANAIGYDFIALGAYPQAEASFEEARQLERPRPLHALIGLAVTNRVIGNYAKAARILDDAIRISSSKPEMKLFYHRGRILLETGSSRDAIIALSRAIAMDENYSWSRTYRSCAYVQEGEPKLAVADAREAVRLFEKDVRAADATAPWFNFEKKRLHVELGIISALSEGQSVTSADKESLCHSFWNDGEVKRTRSALLQN